VIFLIIYAFQLAYFFIILYKEDYRYHGLVLICLRCPTFKIMVKYIPTLSFLMQYTLVLEFDEIVAYIILISVTTRNILGLGEKIWVIARSIPLIKVYTKILCYCAIFPFDKVYTKNVIYWLYDGELLTYVFFDNINICFIHHFIRLNIWLVFQLMVVFLSYL
jgi:hypothetical protein